MIHDKKKTLGNWDKNTFACLTKRSDNYRFYRSKSKSLIGLTCVFTVITALRKYNRDDRDFSVFIPV